jgi:hypothetical protein
MSKQDTLISRKRKGPAPTGKGTPVLVRLQPDQLAALDAWIAKQPEAMTRPEAVRRLLAVRFA